jgi:hypothetical protein
MLKLAAADVLVSLRRTTNILINNLSSGRKMTTQFLRVTIDPIYKITAGK